jgi:hypothetical protein
LAKKRTKKEAKRRIEDLPLLPAPNPAIPVLNSPQYRILKLLERPAKELAKVLVTADPLNRLEDETTTAERIDSATKAFEILVNDPNIKMGAEELNMINDNGVEIADTDEGRIPIRFGDSLSGRETIRRSGQFSRQNLLPRLPGNSKRARKKTNTDKNMSKALREANSRLRTKSGKLRKGKSQGDVMKLAHRLRKKMR